MSGPAAWRNLRAQLSVAKKRHAMPPGKQDSVDALQDPKVARAGLRATRNALRRLDPVALSQDFDNPFGSMDRREKVRDMLDHAVEVGALLDDLRVHDGLLIPAAAPSPAVEVHTRPGQPTETVVMSSFVPGLISVASRVVSRVIHQPIDSGPVATPVTPQMSLWLP